MKTIPPPNAAPKLLQRCPQWTTLLLTFHFSLLTFYLPAQSRDIRTQATYGSDTEAPRSKWEYYHDMWSERDVKHGRYSEWMANDKLALQGFYFDDLQDSLWQFWYLNGNPKETSWWNAGKRDGKTSHFDKKGRLIQERTYKQGVAEGITIDYYQNGRVRQIAQYRAGQMHGNVTTYNRKGIRQHILQYAEGRRTKEPQEEKAEKEDKGGKQDKEPKKTKAPEESKAPKAQPEPAKTKEGPKGTHPDRPAGPATSRTKPEKPAQQNKPTQKAPHQ